MFRGMYICDKEDVAFGTNVYCICVVATRSQSRIQGPLVHFLKLSPRSHKTPQSLENKISIIPSVKLTSIILEIEMANTVMIR